MKKKLAKALTVIVSALAVAITAIIAIPTSAHADSPGFSRCIPANAICFFQEPDGRGDYYLTYSHTGNCVNWDSTWNDTFTSVENTYDKGTQPYRVVMYWNANCSGSSKFLRAGDTVSMNYEWPSSGGTGFNDNFSSFELQCSGYDGCYL